MVVENINFLVYHPFFIGFGSLNTAPKERQNVATGVNPWKNTHPESNPERVTHYMQVQNANNLEG